MTVSDYWTHNLSRVSILLIQLTFNVQRSADSSPHSPLFSTYFPSSFLVSPHSSSPHQSLTSPPSCQAQFCENDEELKYKYTHAGEKQSYTESTRETLRNMISQAGWPWQHKFFGDRQRRERKKRRRVLHLSLED